MAGEGGTMVGKNATAEIRGQTLKMETEVRQIDLIELKKQGQ
ncbi:hypothetical protein BH20VER3_BH20VER3_20440 [soil metagenome]